MIKMLGFSFCFSVFVELSVSTIIQYVTLGWISTNFVEKTGHKSTRSSKLLDVPDIHKTRLHVYWLSAGELTVRIVGITQLM